MSAYYSTLVLVGPDKLYSLLGQELYNQIYPPGGLALVVCIFLLILWISFPVVLGAAVSRMPARRLALSLDVPYKIVWPALISIVLGVGHIIYFSLFLESPSAYLLPVFFGNDTRYASGYSDWRFRKVKQGMSMAAVRATLGEPVRVYPSPDGDSWWYTESPNDSSFWVRSVRLTRQAISQRSIMTFTWTELVTVRGPAPCERG